MGSRGQMVSFDDVRGYGFVEPEDGGADVFVHVNDLEFDKHQLDVGTFVEFDLVGGDRGPKASHVRLSSGPSAVANGAAPTTPRTTPVHADKAGPTGAARRAGAPSSTELASAVTEALLSNCPSATASQIVCVRDAVVRLARDRDWVDDAR